MKKILLLMFALSAMATGTLADVQINSINFPDNQFRNFLLAQTYGQDGKLTDAEIASITSLNLNDKGIQNLRGIKYFTALTFLRIYNNEIVENEMEHFVRELPKQANATAYVYNQTNSNEKNYMSYVQAYAAAEKGWTTMNIYMMDGYEFPNGIANFAPTIIAKYITPDEFPDANFFNAIVDYGFGYSYNGIRYFTQEDIYRMNYVETIDISGRNITSIKGIEYFPAMVKLDCSDNQLTELDLSKNPALEYLGCSSNQLTELDLSKNPALYYLSCDNNQLTNLNVSKNTALEYIYCNHNQLTTLDMPKSTVLVTLYCDNNQLTTLDVSKNTALETLSCSYNELTALNLTKNTALETLYCDNNQLTTLDVSKNTALETLSCSYNELTTLNLTKNTALGWLNCANNRLTNIDVSKNTALIVFYCENNQLTTLDVSKNLKLERLSCFSNKIRGAGMDALIASLPENYTDKDHVFVPVSKDENNGNVCTKKQVADAKLRGWNTYYDVGNHMWMLYEGSDVNGDVNGDGNVNSADVQKIYALMAQGATGTTNPEADLNDDGRINSADIQKVYAIMAGGGDDSHAPAGAVAVDLGLPSGTKWANMNVGAEKPEDYGLYFAWGEIRGYTSDTGDGRRFDWASYKWMNEGQSSWQQINKYQVADGQTDACWYDTNGNFIGDGQSTLLPEDDAARANWGGQWRMPTVDEIGELLDNTTSEWTTVNGIDGRKFTSKANGNSIFLPAAGYRYDASLGRQSTGGYYSSASVPSSYSGDARYLFFDPGGAYWNRYGRRDCGQSVRPVLRN